MEAPNDWKDDINQIVADTVESTWVYPKYVMLLCGLPGAGKGVFRGVLTAGFREAFERKRNADGTTPEVRVCGSEFNEAHANLLRGSGQKMMLNYRCIAADVVIIDEMHLTEANRQRIIAVVTSERARVGCEGAVYMVKLSCRDEAHALKLNKQSRRPLPTATVEVLFQQFAADSGTDVPAFTVGSFAQPE
ncbi:hypothetical protein PR003_g23741 [Phytophthora rubi]|uniref:AAA+ ATPase domain-containing protein n=1 Tax=Phytophthora rubi TaxID=129364 RepID=A0A6A3ICD5_9STRA|nr:hypothetical protein PR001_g24220 [Phytophthora rubi]KAE9296503.1 hypothetical protein PR003_g23741 [Phytophthora rubi]